MTSIISIGVTDLRTQDRLPYHLKKYCTEHDYDKYTARDQAGWRYIMRRALPFFRENAVNGYEKGLEATGIGIESIPHIDNIDRKMQDFGWGAVPVCGFIPPWAFLEFQARRILPIATDMRTVDHIAYTPAPDIVHEAAGHAPILPDQDYNSYLSHYASLGCKAIYSREDLDLYEAIRVLSDIKEKPESTAAEITEAERHLQATTLSITYVSEAAKVGRMSWWTAEYGLAGDIRKPKIFGAGLLSSVGESKQAITDKVKKIPLSILCTQYSYNITEPQPQLFVAEDMQHLHSVLEDLDSSLSYRIGGLSALAEGKKARAVTTSVLNSGVAISGIIDDYEPSRGNIAFIKMKGPVQLSKSDQEIKGQGINQHPEGFSSPIGRWKRVPLRPPHKLTEEELNRRCGLILGRPSKIEFLSGIEVFGTPTQFQRDNYGNLIVISFQNCHVKWGDRLLFDPSWGTFDMVVGDEVSSVYGGPADRQSYGEHEISETNTTPGREVPYTDEENKLFDYYSQVREFRESNLSSSTVEERETIKALSEKLVLTHPSEWLLMIEVIELSKKQWGLNTLDHAWLFELEEHLYNNQNSITSEQRTLAQYGLQNIS